MRAAVYENFKEPLALMTVPDPVPGDDAVILEVKCIGICRSDWHGWMGHDPDVCLPHVPGHEMSGVIVEIGKNIKKWQPGDRVTLPFVCGCGRCQPCIEGNQQVCDHQFQPGFTHWGSFATLVAIDYAENNLVKLPESVDFLSASVLGCRFATSFRALVDQGELAPGQWLAVYGCGGVGLSAVMIAQALEARVIAVDIKPEHLELASSLGAEITLDAAKAGTAEAILDLTCGGTHLSIDALGRHDILVNSISSLRKGGRHIQIGLFPPDRASAPIPMDRIISRELEIKGSHGMQAYRYPQMLQMMVDGKLNPRKLITSTISLKDSMQVLTEMNTFKRPGITVITDFSS